MEISSDIQQTIVLVATILGWVLLAGAIGFAGFVFIKLYLGRDKAAAEAKKQKEAAAKEAKKVAKEQKAPASKRVLDQTPGNAELKQRLQSKAQAPKREDVVSRLAETSRPPQPSPQGTDNPLSSASVKSFLDDDGLDEYDFAKQKAGKENPDSVQPKQGRNGGFPPPPPRL